MGNKVTVNLDKMNLSVKERHYTIIDHNDLKPKVSVLPRTPDPIYIPPKMKKQKRIWTFPISIWFKDFKFETEDLLRKCFEKDWACSKIMKVVKNPDELNEVKNVLWAHYRYHVSINKIDSSKKLIDNIVPIILQVMCGPSHQM